MHKIILQNKRERFIVRKNEFRWWKILLKKLSFSPKALEPFSKLANLTSAFTSNNKYGKLECIQFMICLWGHFFLSFRYRPQQHELAAGEKKYSVPISSFPVSNFVICYVLNEIKE